MEGKRGLGRNMSSNYLMHLYDLNKDDKDIMTTLTSVGNLKSFINKHDLPRDLSSLLIHLFARGVRCTTGVDSSLQLLCTLLESRLFTSKTSELLQQHEDESESKHPFGCLIDDLVVIIEQLFQRVPNSATTLPVIGLIHSLSQITLISDEVCNKDTKLETITKLKGNLLDALREKSKVQIKPKLQDDTEDMLLPPDDFRRVSIFPSDADIFGTTEFLRRNKVLGKYLDLNHYLDVQFRLYREDFISPLRSAVKEYINIRETYDQVKPHNIRLEDGRLYRNIVVTGISTLPECGEVYNLQLDIQHAKMIKWFYSKRLIYGSLVCLSFDEFQTIMFGVIVDSDRESLSRSGEFKAQILRTRTSQKVPRFQKGLMIESSSAYFESYRHVLAALKNIGEDTPFLRYIVNCETDISPPYYLSTGRSKYDFTPVLQDRSTERFVDVIQTDEWPDMNNLQLDAAQWEAFHAALTKEFVIIQGPPGTGKTHIGLMIAKTLLHNKRIWTTESIRNEVTKCIMIVCFTNHALDQFLEGIIRFSNETNLQSIVRIGSRCKNPLIEEYTLAEHRHRYLSNNPEKRHQLHRFKYNARDTMQLVNNLKYQIREIQSILHRIKTENVVIDYSTLKGVIAKAHKEEFGQQTPDKNFLNWLQVTEEWWYRQVEQFYQGHLKFGPKQTLFESGNQENNIFIDIISEAEFEFSERHIDDEDEDIRRYNYSKVIGLDIDKQLARNEKKNIEDKCRRILRHEAEKAKQNLRSGEKVSKDTSEIITNLWELTLEDRWNFYRYWVSLYIELQQKRLADTQEMVNSLYDAYKEAKLQVEEDILSQASVIALTTTAAARYYSTLAKLVPTVTIVEEAAEVLEAHIVTALSKNCEHVILIGDHKQLEPKPAVYELAIRYNLSVSLFERMINNKLPFYCLQKQHRMRPEIADLVRHIYPVLVDNDNVLTYSNVGGIRQNLYFINHSNPEEYNDDGRSYSNAFEAEYAKTLCQYLLHQGYKPDQITILAAYSGQMYKIREQMLKTEFDGVRVCVLDNYQGEENEIIILSLVRSNESGDIGFLNKENRICVALSRARIGLYILGNMQTLTKKSKHWQVIERTLKSDETVHIKGKNIGNALLLYCQNHPEKPDIYAVSPSDFKKAPDGGCGIRCEFRLDCGHACRFKCHSFDKDHKEYKCTKKCPKTCPEGHICTRVCHEPEDCECQVKLEKSLPCGHINFVPCYMNPSQHPCYTELQRTLPCGHTATIQCHEDIKTYKCYEDVKETRYGCGHTYIRKCFQGKIKFENENECKYQVEKTFKRCQHKIDVLCFQDIEKLDCRKGVSKTFNCGHTIETLCFRANKLICKELCENVCEEGHPCNKTCHFPDSCECSVIVERQIPACNHMQHMKCCLNVDVFECKEVVDKILPHCGHSNKVECFQPVKSISCNTKVTKKMKSCGHEHILPCGVDPCLDNIPCLANTSLFMKRCGHTITVSCWERNDEKLKCTAPVPYTYTKCKHKANIPCWLKREAEMQSTDTTSTVSVPPCSQMIEQMLLCGHTITAECHIACVDLTCSFQCNKVLFCGHVCKNMCSDCQGGEFHAACSMKCNKYKLCGHKCEDKCMQCKPCNKQCTFSCEHKSCSLLCANPCQPCKKMCSWQCPHFKCSKACSEICDRAKCTRACKTILQCGHVCQGYCGEPCPESCLNCKPDMYPQISSVDTAMYKTVTLKDCGHTFPEEYLDEYMRKTKDLLVAKCPVCNIVVHKNPRYDRILKCKKQFTEQTKKTIQEKSNDKITFPVFKEDVFDAIKAYLKKFLTFRQIKKHLNSDYNFLRCIKDAHGCVRKIENSLDFTCSLQTTVDIFRQVYKLYVYWILCICIGKPNVLQYHFDSNSVSEIIFKESDLQGHDAISRNKIKTFLEMGARPKSTSERKFTGHDLVEFIREKIQYTSFDRMLVDRLLLQLINKIEDEAHLESARLYPVQPGLIGIHDDDWVICRKGHVYSCISTSNCDMCQNKVQQSSTDLRSKQSPKGEKHTSLSNVQDGYERQSFGEWNLPKMSQDKKAGYCAEDKESFKTNVRHDFKKQSNSRARGRGRFSGDRRRRPETKPVYLHDFLPAQSKVEVTQRIQPYPEEETNLVEEFPSLGNTNRTPSGDLILYQRREDDVINYQKKGKQKRKSTKK